MSEEIAEACLLLGGDERVVDHVSEDLAEALPDDVGCSGVLWVAAPLRPGGRCSREGQSRCNRDGQDRRDG